MAAYLPEYNGLFVHCPKTGGTFIVQTLQELGIQVKRVGYKHSHKNLVGPLRYEKDPVVFTLVRHPISWYESYWKMSFRELKDGEPWFYWQPTTAWHPNWPIDPSCGADTFDQFIRNLVAQPYRIAEMFQWYTGLGTRDQAHLIGKQESLTADLMRFLDMLGAEYDKQALLNADPINTAGPEKNARPKPPVPPSDWTPELRQLVLDAEADFLVNYGYDENGPLTGEAAEPKLRVARPNLEKFTPKPWTPVLSPA